MRGLLISFAMTLMALSQRMAYFLQEGFVAGALAPVQGVLGEIHSRVTFSTAIGGSAPGLVINSLAENVKKVDHALAYNGLYQGVFLYGLLGGYETSVARGPVWIVLPANHMPFGQDYIVDLLASPVEAAITFCSADSYIAERAKQLAEYRKLFKELGVPSVVARPPVGSPVIGSGAHSLTSTANATWSHHSSSKIHYTDTISLVNSAHVYPSTVGATSLDLGDVNDVHKLLIRLLKNLNLVIRLLAISILSYKFRTGLHRITIGICGQALPIMTDSLFLNAPAMLALIALTYKLFSSADVCSIALKLLKIGHAPHAIALLMGLYLRIVDSFCDDLERSIICVLQPILLLLKWAYANELLRWLLLKVLLSLRSFLPYYVISPLAAMGALFVRPGSRLHKGLTIFCFLGFFFWVFLVLVLDFVVGAQDNHQGLQYRTALVTSSETIN